MGFNRDVIRRRRDELNEMGVRVRWVGRPPRLWGSVITELEDAEQLTAGNTALTLQICVNYGGRAEIADAAAAMAADVAAGKLRPDQIDEKLFARYLDEPGHPDVDLFIRSSGEQRTSNFLLWQSAYAEFVFLRHALARLRPPAPVAGLRDLRLARPALRRRRAERAAQLNGAAPGGSAGRVEPASPRRRSGAAGQTAEDLDDGQADQRRPRAAQARLDPEQRGPGQRGQPAEEGQRSAGAGSRPRRRRPGR